MLPDRGPLLLTIISTRGAEVAESKTVVLLRTTPWGVIDLGAGGDAVMRDDRQHSAVSAPVALMIKANL